MIGSLLTVFSGPYALIARLGLVAIVAVALFGYGWFKGNSHGSQKLYDYQAEELRESVRLGALRERVTTKVVTEYIERAGITERTVDVIEKEVIRYVKAHPDSACLDSDWRRLHDAAAEARVPTDRPVVDGPLRAAGNAAGG